MTPYFLTVRAARAGFRKAQHGWILGSSVLAISHSANAQRVISTIDVGGAGIRYADSVRTSAFTVSPGLQLNFDRATLGVSGAYSQLGSGSWTTQGDIGGSLYTPAAGWLLGELSGTAGGSAHHDGTRTGQTLGIVRGHLMTAGRGVWVGGGAGSMWDGTAWRRLFEGEAGFWSRLGENTTALATITPTVVDDSIHYSDAELSVRWDGPRVELGASAGLRSGQQWRTDFGSTDTWGSASITAWLTSNMAVVGSGGTYPVDLTQGYPGGRFVSLALRFGNRSAHRAANPVSRGGTFATEGVETGLLRGFEVIGTPDGQRMIRVRAPNADVVEITADFTDWSPVGLTKSARGWWSVTLRMAPGTHQVNARLDGGPWLVPPTLTALRDEFGGETGLLIVPL